MSKNRNKIAASAGCVYRTEPLCNLHVSDPKTTASVCTPCIMDRSKAFRITRHWLPQHWAHMPSDSDVREVLGYSKFISYDAWCSGFCTMLESAQDCTCLSNKVPYMLHGTVHNFADGTMAFFPSSTYDPLFIVHHTQVDRLFERWRRALKPSSREVPQHTRSLLQCRECTVGTYNPPLRYRDLFTDVEAIGYSYENYKFGNVGEDEKIARMNIPYKPKTCKIFLKGNKGAEWMKNTKP